MPPSRWGWAWNHVPGDRGHAARVAALLIPADPDDFFHRAGRQRGSGQPLSAMVTGGQRAGAETSRPR